MISGIKALTFDVGGTVLDWHRGITRAFADAGARRGLNKDWPAITNEYRRRALQAMVGQANPSFNIDDVHSDVGLRHLVRDDRHLQDASGGLSDVREVVGVPARGMPHGRVSQLRPDGSQPDCY
jgi:FMN phosphatase YigB (HAD superfamily)